MGTFAPSHWGEGYPDFFTHRWEGEAPLFGNEGLLNQALLLDPLQGLLGLGRSPALRPARQPLDDLLVLGYLLLLLLPC